MNKSVTPLLVIFGLIYLRGHLAAGLAWEQKSLSFDPKISDTEVVAHFKFQNKGKSAVTIRSVDASCHCTEATVAKPFYAPGETGEIIARFSIEDRTGQQEVEISVLTDDTQEPESILQLGVNVPAIARIEPDPLMWLPGGTLDPKRIRIIPSHGLKMKITEVKVSAPDISAQIVPGSASGVFEIIVTPCGNQPAFSGSLRIETDFPAPHPRALIAHVQITR